MEEIVVSVGSIGDRWEVLRGKCLFVLGLLQSDRSVKSTQKAIQMALQYLMVTTDLPLLQACTLHMAQNKKLLDSKAAIAHMEGCIGRLSQSEGRIYEKFISGSPVIFQLILENEAKGVKR